MKTQTSFLFILLFILITPNFILSLEPGKDTKNRRDVSPYSRASWPITYSTQALPKV